MGACRLQMVLFSLIDQAFSLPGPMSTKILLIRYVAQARVELPAFAGALPYNPRFWPPSPPQVLAKTLSAAGEHCLRPLSASGCIIFVHRTPPEHELSLYFVLKMKV